MTKSIKIKAIGVFDTVGALGIPIHPLIWRTFPFIPTFLRSTYRFYDTAIGEHVENAFHALALDEQRAAFSPTVWEKQDNASTNLEQVWFSGVHSNVGGGYTDAMVSTMSLAWMMQKLRDHIAFDESYLKTQVQANQAFYKDKPMKDNDAGYKLGDLLWRWGLGLVYNSNVLPTRLGGSLVRTPFMYKQTDPATGKPKKVDSGSNNLKNTNEMIHPSVRARYAHGGKNYSGAAYKSDSLKDWRLQGTSWEYTGTATGSDAPASKSIAESTMAGYEIDVLDFDPQMKRDLGFGESV